MPPRQRRLEDEPSKKSSSRSIHMPELSPVIATNAASPRLIADAFDTDVAFRLAFVGAGQCGGRLVERFWELGYRRCLAVNTAHTDLEELHGDLPKLDLETGGAGKDMEYGQAAVDRRSQEVFEMLARHWGDQVDYVFVCAGLGGGTGGGACVKLVELARRYLKDNGGDPQRVGALVSLPQENEGPRVCRNATKAFSELHKTSPSPFVIIDNKRISQLYQVGINQFYGVCNEKVTDLLHVFNRLAAQKSHLITFDQADFASLLDAGIVVFGASNIDKYDSPADVAEAIRLHLEQSVLAQVDLKQGRVAACVFVGGEDILNRLPMDYFDGGFEMFDRLLLPDSLLHRGIYQGSRDSLYCYTMISQLPPPLERLRALAAKGGVTRDGVAGYLGVDDAE
jgi:cell division GTPase FtsZ